MTHYRAKSLYFESATASTPLTANTVYLVTRSLSVTQLEKKGVYGNINVGDVINSGWNPDDVYDTNVIAISGSRNEIVHYTPPDHLIYATYPLRSLRSKSGGKWYTEHTIYSTQNNDGDSYLSLGIGSIDTPLLNYIGSPDAVGSVGYVAQTATVRYDGTNLATGFFILDSGDTVGMAIDLDNKKLYYSKNNVWSVNPSTGNGIDISFLEYTDFYIMASMGYRYDSQLESAFETNYLQYDVPSGYHPGFGDVFESNIPESYNNSITFTVDGSKITSNLTDFPVRLYLSPSGSGDIDWSPVFTEIGDNNKKISIQDSNGNEHYTEISCWSPSASIGILDFKVPTLSAGVDTEFTFYYDNDVVDNDTYVGTTGSSAAQNVWDGNYIGVWHLVTDPTGIILDSTSNGNNAEDDGNMTSDALMNDDLVLKYTNFNGSSGFIQVSSYSETTYTNGLCFESLWNYPDLSWATNSPVLNQKQTGTTGSICGMYQTASDDKMYFGHRVSNDTGWTAISTDYAVTDNVWNYSAGMYDAGYAKIKINSEEINQSAFLNRSILYDSVIFIGGNLSVISKIKISESRISNIERSNDWLNATNYTLKDILILSQADSINVSPLVDLQSLSLTQYSPTVYSEISPTVLVNLLNKSLTQFETLTSISISPDVNVLNLGLSQLGTSIESSSTVIVNQLNKSLTQLTASLSYSGTKEVNLLSRSIDQLESIVKIDKVQDLNLLTLGVLQPSASIFIDPDVYLNLNILQQQMLINSVTLGIVNRILFPIIDGVNYSFEFKDDTSSITKGIDKVSGGEPLKSGLDKTYSSTQFIKGIEIVKR